MTQVIIYKTDEGGVAIVHPTQEALKAHTITEVALKDVPAGRKFKLMDAAAIPSDRSARDAWTVDETDLTDGVGGVSSEFEVQP
jgi:hypothetical protein